MLLESPKIEKEDYIQREKYKLLDGINGIKYIDMTELNSLSIEDLSKNVYITKDELDGCISNDLNNTFNRISIEKIKYIKFLFSQNVLFDYNNIMNLPLGIENDFSNNIIQEVIYKKSIEEKKIINTLYICNTINTIERYNINKHYSTNKYNHITYNEPNRNNFIEYINNIYNHKFMLCPYGNMPDCHRMWECLYLGCIPIVKWSDYFKNFVDLPILYVDNFNDINNIEFLNTSYNKILNGKYNYNKLKFSYWKQLIINTKN